MDNVIVDSGQPSMSVIVDGQNEFRAFVDDGDQEVRIIVSLGESGQSGNSGPIDIGDVTGLQDALDGKQAAGSYANAAHGHLIGDITGLGAALDGKQAAGSYANAAHGHVIGDVTGLQTALDGKQAAGSYANAAHGHVIGDVTGLQTALDGKQAAGSYANAAHAHVIADVTGLQTALDGKQAAGSYANAAHGHVIGDVTGLQAALDGKAASSHGHVIGDVTGLQTALDGKQSAGSYANATHAHVIGDVTGLQTALDGKQAAGSYANAAHGHVIGDVTGLQAALDGKQGILTRSTAHVIETDFYNNAATGLTFIAISSGTMVVGQANQNHPGVQILRDSTTAGGGFRVQTDISVFLLAGGERFTLVFQVRGVRAGMTCYAGFFDTQSATAPTDCACFVITGNGTTASLVGRTRANNTATETSPITISTNTWYTAVITVNSNATSCNFALYAENGTLIGQGDLANLPTAVGRETGAGVIASESSTDAAAELMALDYMKIEVNRTLTR